MALLPLPNPATPWVTRWKSLIDPLLRNNLNSVEFLTGIVLASGTTTFPHKLGRKMQGWFITDIDGASTIYRAAPFNELTLTLTSSSQVTVNIGVF